MADKGGKLSPLLFRRGRPLVTSVSWLLLITAKDKRANRRDLRDDLRSGLVPALKACHGAKVLGFRKWGSDDTGYSTLTTLSFYTTWLVDERTGTPESGETLNGEIKTRAIVARDGSGVSLWLVVKLSPHGRHPHVIFAFCLRVPCSGLPYSKVLLFPILD